jgi:putative transposase
MTEFSMAKAAGEVWSTRAQARNAIFEYIELFYNRRRRHSAIGYLCPNQFELRHHESMAA